jgi:hypothetical protein
LSLHIYFLEQAECPVGVRRYIFNCPCLVLIP